MESAKSNVLLTMCAKNYSQQEREKDDFYATSPEAIDLLFNNTPDIKSNVIWECATGKGHLAKRMHELGAVVKCTELHRRENMLIDNCNFDVNFLQYNEINYSNIVTNPPYKLAEQFIRKSIEITKKEGVYICMFLPIRYLEGKSRGKLFNEYPPWKIIVSSSRIQCAINGEFDKLKNSSAQGYAWFVWLTGYKGKTFLEWGN